MIIHTSPFLSITINFGNCLESNALPLRQPVLICQRSAFGYVPTHLPIALPSPDIQLAMFQKGFTESVYWVMLEAGVVSKVLRTGLNVRPRCWIMYITGGMTCSLVPEADSLPDIIAGSDDVA
ncbi:hypothetical protein TWF225_011456 [Orbilia oligospora]|nr:hypothetical protein TWF225_011456 [Orbilia oligospora]